MASFMARWRDALPVCSGLIHQSLSDGKTNLFFDVMSPPKMSKLFGRQLAGRARIARLCREHRVERLEVCGSAADGRFSPARSDFDFIVTFPAAVQPSAACHFVGLADEL